MLQRARYGLWLEAREASIRAWLAAGLALCLAACNRQPEAKPAFDIAHRPGPVERVECRQGECYWTQRQSVTVLSRAGDGVRIKVTGRGGSSVHGLDAAPPHQWSPGIEVEWHPQVVYFRCSLTDPAMLWEADGAYVLDTLNLHAMPGVQVASGNEYMAACHNFAPGKWGEKTIKRLGYARTASEQTRYPTLEAGLEAMSD